MLVVRSALLRAKEVYETEQKCHPELRQGDHSDVKFQLTQGGARKIDPHPIVRWNRYLQTPVLPPLDNL